MPHIPCGRRSQFFSYSERSWQPRDEQLTFALALTNTTSTESLPQKIIDKYNAVKTSPAGEERLGNMLKSCFIGDAYQRLLPRNFKVPYIGWHPVESTMNPRNQYDYTKFSWGRNTPREYGVPNNRKLANLTRGLFKEVCRNRGVGMTEQSFVEGSRIRQFFRAKDGKLVRFYFDLPFTVLGRNPLENMKYETQRDVPDVTPLNPVTALFKENIYEEINNHPVLNKQHSHPYVHTVFRHYVSHIAPKYCEDHEQARCLIYAYAAALGQARLLYGSDIGGDLPTPITINSISTNGPKFILSCFQLNSLDLASSQTNNFAFTATPLDLFEFCDLDQARVRFTGLNMDTYRWLEAMLTQD